MFYVYILESSRDGNLYVGCTKDLKHRLDMHNSGQVISTKDRRPLKVIYCELFLDKHDAFAREQWLKTGWGRNQIKKMLSHYLKKV